jgi:hypothetical protein
LGNDWDKDLKVFHVNSGYEVFKDDFDFSTTRKRKSDGTTTHHTSFIVTLNARVDSKG